MFDLIQKFFEPKDEVPNRFTRAMGKLIRQARLEIKMSQVELAQKAFFRQAAISDIENGKRNVTAAEIVYLSYALDKPILYFFPKDMITSIDSDNLTIAEQELISQARRLSSDDLRKIIAQAKALADLE